jgi:hypothetical protein
MEVSNELHAPVALPPGKEPPIPTGYGDWVGLIACMDVIEKRKNFPLPGIEPRSSSSSLYRLSYPGSQQNL